MNSLIYFLVGLISTTVGAISGLGGGVIIKPVLDILGNYDIASIGVLSTFTVFSMSVVSLGKSIKNKVKLDGKRTISLAIGSILGGVIGKSAFQVFLNILNNDGLAQKIQSVILFLLMLAVIILYSKEGKIKGFKIESVSICFIVGLILGIIASFLGIGGGPLNVIVLMYILGMDAKSSAIHSIFIIFFSQGSKLITILLNEGFLVYSLEVVVYMIIGGILGGFLGSDFSRRMKREDVKKLFIYCMILIMCFNFYNIIK
ncbi:sulfite exporter TauE/SafE family protein [Faecalimicrobium sp. JNUCC 81]